jgi:hypothetical protein
LGDVRGLRVCRAATTSAVLDSILPELLLG